MMWGSSNPYQAALDAIEEAVDACQRAMAASENLPLAKGGRDVHDPLYVSSLRLHEARRAAELWRDSFNHHLGRTDF
jgi:hypothetical protein